MPANNNYEVELSQDGLEVYGVFETDMPTTHSLYPARVTIMNNIAASHPTRTAYSKLQNGTYINPRPKMP